MWLALRLSAYQEDLPPVLCHGGAIGQALLNVIVNAAQAIGEVSGQTKALGLLALSTRGDGGDVVMSIRDSGGGIPESVQTLVFDPFFTTKEVGKGTGQGSRSRAPSSRPSTAAR
jgi:two-component system NtrC family sensor kinase